MSADLKPEVLKYTLTSKTPLSPEELELYELSQLSEILIEQNIFKIILDLLSMNVAPLAVLQVLKSMCASGQRK